MTVAANGSGSNPSVESDKISAYLVPALQKAGLPPETVQKYALLARDVYDYIQANPEVKAGLRMYEAQKKLKSAGDIYEGSAMVYKTTQYLNNGAALGLTSAASGFSTIRAGAAGTALTGFVDIFEGIAKSYGIELNDCALSVTKVTLDFVGVMAAGTGIGLVVAGMAVLSVGKDSYALGQACIPTEWK
jgi:hypothetical protein